MQQTQLKIQPKILQSTLQLIRHKMQPTQLKIQLIQPKIRLTQLM
jgi:hypothetical protein